MVRVVHECVSMGAQNRSVMVFIIIPTPPHCLLLPVLNATHSFCASRPGSPPCRRPETTVLSQIQAHSLSAAISRKCSAGCTRPSKGSACRAPAQQHLWGGGVRSVSTRVSPVALVGCVPTGHMTVAAASCPRAAALPKGRGRAPGGPPLAGRHSLPRCPGTFARWFPHL